MSKQINMNNFKMMFFDYCRNEVEAGNCNEGDCQWCAVNMAWYKIFYSRSSMIDNLKNAVHEALLEYDSDNVDIVVNYDGSIDIMWHSDNNSFCINENVCNMDDIDEDDIIEIANEYDIGYVL